MENWQQGLETHPAAVKFLFDEPAVRERTSDASFSVMNGSGNPEIIHVHRIFLAIRSSVFDAMFYGPMANKTMPVTVEDIRADVFTAMIRYIYTDGVEIVHGSNVIELLHASHKYDIKSLFNYCVKFISEHLASDSVLSVLEHANLVDAAALTQACYKFIDHNTAKVLCHDSFTSQSWKTVRSIVNRDTLATDGMPEKCIYKTCLLWGRATAAVEGKTGPASLRAAMASFLSHIRFPLLAPPDIVEATKDGILTAEECNDLLALLLKVDGIATRFTKEDRIGRKTGLAPGSVCRPSSSGKRSREPMKQCNACNGQGSAYDAENCWNRCKLCAGKGQVPSHKCKMCS